MKTLEQINQEFLAEIAFSAGGDQPAEEPIDEYTPSSISSLEDIRQVIDLSSVEQDEKRSIGKKASDILFFVVIALVLIVTLMFGGKAHDSFNLMGYSAFTVLSGSMQREIPEGSLVITKNVDPSAIKVGDDITFMGNDHVTVTHRVVGIFEDYEGSGSRVFETQGLENPEPDRDVVYAGNVIGLVELSIPGLGFTLNYVSEHLGIVFAILGGILVATIALSKVLSSRREELEAPLSPGQAA